MKNIKKFLVVSFMFLVTLTITGCGKNYSKSNLSAKEAFEKSNTATATVTSYKMEMLMDMAAKVEGKEQSVYMKDSTSLDIKNMLSYNEISTNLFGTDMKIESYSKYADNTITVYTNFLGSWSKQEKEFENYPNIAGNLDDLINLDSLINSDYIKEIAADKDNYNYEANISAEDLKKISALVGEETATDMVDSFNGNIKMIISFDKSTGYISKLKIDLMDIVKDLPKEETNGAEYTKALMEIKFYDYNKVGEIVIPQEALNVPDEEDVDIDFEGFNDETTNENDETINEEE